MITHNGHLYVVVPEGATNFRIHDALASLYYDLPDKKGLFIDLPPGYSYEILGISSQCSEEQAALIVERDYSFKGAEIWKEYYNAWGYCLSAIQSLRSLHSANNLPYNETLIVKQTKI